MAGRVSRRAAALVGIACLVGLSALAGITGRTGWALAGVTGLLGGVLIFQLDLRWRIGDLAHMQRRAASRQADLRSLVGRVDNRQADHRAVTKHTNREVLEAYEYLRAMERRVVSILEGERLRSSDRYREFIEAFGTVPSEITELGGNLDGIRRPVDRLARDIRNSRLRELETLLQLNRRISPRATLPESGGYALDARSLSHLLDIIEAERPVTVLELGSGTSTIWLAYLLEGSDVRFVSIDHDEFYAGRTRTELERHGLADTVDLRVAPLVPVGVRPAGGEDGVEGDRLWYDRTTFADVRDIDLLVVDGPPKATGPLARWPALPLLTEQLASGAVVVLDDADRPDEARSIELWRATDARLAPEDEGISRLAVLRRLAG